MKLNVYTVYDSKAEIYIQPFCLQTRGEAIRSWDDVVNDPKTQYYKHPSDFTLFELGTYDTLTSKYNLLDAKIPIGSGNEFKKDMIQKLNNL